MTIAWRPPSSEADEVPVSPGISALEQSAGSPRASGSTAYQKDVVFAHCMRSHGVPYFPDPLPQGGFPRTGGVQTAQSTSAMNTCQHLLPPKPVQSAAEQARIRVMRGGWKL
jgi:hypothetical protein